MSKNFKKIIICIAVIAMLTSCLKNGEYQKITKETPVIENPVMTSGARTALSGESIFRGIFFLEGEVPLSLPSIKQYAIDLKNLSEKDPNVQSHRKQLADDIIANINSINPLFFETFKTQILSDNLYEVKDILMQSGKLIEQAGLSSPKYTNIFRLATSALNNPQVNQEIKEVDVTTEMGKQKLDSIVESHNLPPNELFVCTPAAAVCVYYLIAVAHSQAAVTYNVIGAINLIGYFTVIVKTKTWFWDRGSNPGSETMNDLFVKEIADNF